MVKKKSINRRNPVAKNSGKFNKAKVPKCQSKILSIANPLTNPVGTAMGMYFKHKNTKLIILPGVPLEMESMLNFYLNSKSLFKVQKQNIVTINTAGIYETKLSNKMKSFMKKYDNQIYFSFLPSYDGVKIRLVNLNSSFNLDIVKIKLLEFLSLYAYGEDNETLEIITQFLEQCLIANLNNIQIIHGKERWIFLQKL